MKQSLNIPSLPRVLIVGSGAREHAIAWKLAQSPHRPKLFVAPGNPGFAELGTMVNIAADDVERLVEFAQAESMDLVVVGPEVPLSHGIVDACETAGISAFGPCRRAAVLETSKAAAKEWMKRAEIPTAAYALFDEPEAAKQYVRQQGAPIVVKADGLAAGKGVVVATSVEEACTAIDEMMLGKRFGDSGLRIVIESYMRGEEVSMMFFVDAHTVVPMLPARDYKRVGAGNTGPNTGGMGAYAPVPEFVEAGMVEVVQSRIATPILRALREDGVVYRGVLYVGLMMTEDGPQVVEFNCRFGDPETEVVLPLLLSDLLEVMWSVAHDRLAEVQVEWSAEKAVCAVLAAPGYPSNVRIGSEIAFEGRLSVNDIVFHAGTARTDGQIVTAGGRVLVAVGCGQDFGTARRIAYEVADAIYFEGKYVRRDIAHFH